MSNKKLSPIEAIQKKCTQHNCFIGDTPIKDCKNKECEFHPYRLGEEPKTGCRYSVMEAIAVNCILCCGGDIDMVKECNDEDCALLPYRLEKLSIRKRMNIIVQRQDEKTGEWKLRKVPFNPSPIEFFIYTRASYLWKKIKRLFIKK